MADSLAPKLGLLSVLDLQWEWYIPIAVFLFCLCKHAPSPLEPEEKLDSSCKSPQRIIYAHSGHIWEYSCSEESDSILIDSSHFGDIVGFAQEKCSGGFWVSVRQLVSGDSVKHRVKPGRAYGFALLTIPNEHFHPKDRRVS